MTQTPMSQLIYTIEFILSGEVRSLAICPVDAANGVILDAPEGSNFYQGQTVSGGKFEIPIAAVTNVFATWWKVSVNNGQGHTTYNLDDAAMEDFVNAKTERNRFNENGALTDSTGQEITGKDEEPEKRKVRGNRTP